MKLAGPNPDNVPYADLAANDVMPDDEHVVRDRTYETVTPPTGLNPMAIPVAQPGRAAVRDSISYFSQMTDFQLADEESPARVEFVDPGATSAWRPQEALIPFQVDASVRQINAFANDSPVPDSNAAPNRMDFSLITGDQADNMQRNENIWVRDLLEGGTPELPNFGSGSTLPADYNPVLPGCFAASLDAGVMADALTYRGVQDFGDYTAPEQSLYYDPDAPAGQYAGWPTYTGLMDYAQTFSFMPAGLDVPATGTLRDLPFYVTNGNHDTLVQGNEDANREFEQIATGCLKVLGSTINVLPCTNPDPDCAPPLAELFGNPSAFMLVPPDPMRRFASKAQVKQIYGADGEDDAHGFDFVDSTTGDGDPDENADSNGSASYYTLSPADTPAGFRFISIDTNSDGGVVEQSSAGNIDNPQFLWLQDELAEAEAADEMVVIFGHHPVRSLVSNVPDEAATPCTVDDTHATPPDNPEHDTNPGCDIDPRSSEPIHLGTATSGATPGQSFVDLLGANPHVLAYVPGHTHENRVIPFTRTDGTVWWELNTSAIADWPTQSRLLEVMDNDDGTLSIFGTVLDHASTAGATPAGNTTVATFDQNDLASVGRTLTYNDPQNGPGSGGAPEGAAEDNNVELLVFDPRDAGNPDADGDGIENGLDNCPGIANPGQEDSDNDALGDACEPVAAAGGNQPGSTNPANKPATTKKCKRVKRKKKGAKKTTAEAAKKKRKKRCKARRKKKR